jgi:hypothetical protein
MALTISFETSPAPGITNDLVAVLYLASAPAAEIDRIYDRTNHSSPVTWQFQVASSGVYIIKIHEIPVGSTGPLGILRHDWWQDADSGQKLFERRFYKVDGPDPYDPISTANPAVINDPYFSGKQVTGVFQEGFRYLKPVQEWTQQPSGAIQFAAGVSNEPGQVWSVEILYNVNSNATAQVPFTDMVIISTDTTLNNTHQNKILYVNTGQNKLTITSPAASTIPDGKGFIIKNGQGNAVNVIFQMPPGNSVQFLGRGPNKIVIGKGESIRLQVKVIGPVSFMYCIDHQGQWDRVGELVWIRQVPGVSVFDTYHLDNTIILNGQEYDPNIYVRLNDYVNTLPPSQIVDYATYDALTVIDGEAIYAKKGFFARDAGTGKIRVPDLTNRAVRFLGDSDRIDQLPGGYQHHQVGRFTYDSHIIQKSGTNARIGTLANITDADLGRSPVTLNDGKETRGMNIGFLPGMKI